MSELQWRNGNDSVYLLKDHPTGSLKDETDNDQSLTSDGLTLDATLTMNETEENALIEPETEEEKNPLPKPRRIALFCLVIVLLFVAGVILGYCLGRKEFVNKEENIVEELESCRHGHEKMRDALSSPALLTELHQRYLREINVHPLMWLR